MRHGSAGSANVQCLKPADEAFDYRDTYSAGSSILRDRTELIGADQRR